MAIGAYPALSTHESNPLVISSQAVSRQPSRHFALHRFPCTLAASSLPEAPVQDILAICSSLPEVDFAADDWLIREGGQPGRLYVLVSGEVVVLKGETEIARISEPGAIFGEMSVLLDMPYTASVRAVGPVRTRLSEDPAAFLASNPAIALHAARILARRLHAATAYLADVKMQFADQKNHFGIMDRILESLLQHQPPQAPEPRARTDPRL
jgi:CRP-like cAMP-binding protein